MNVVVRELMVQYRQWGSGRDVVLVHGWGDSAASFDQLMESLAQRYRVTACDLPGFGASQAPPKAWGLDDYASFMEAILKKLGIDRPIALVGHSNGGAILLRALAHNLLQADKLVLLASAGVRGEKRGRNSVLKILAKGGKALAAPLPKSAQATLRRKLYNAAGSDLLVVPHMQETFKRIIADDVRADAARVNVPTLLIYGTDDQQTPETYGKLLQEKLPTAEYVSLDGAGHFIHHDRPKDVAARLMEFIG